MTNLEEKEHLALLWEAKCRFSEEHSHFSSNYSNVVWCLSNLLLALFPNLVTLSLTHSLLSLSLCPCAPLSASQTPWSGLRRIITQLPSRHHAHQTALRWKVTSKHFTSPKPLVSHSILNIFKWFPKPLSSQNVWQDFASGRVGNFKASQLEHIMPFSWALKKKFDLEFFRMCLEELIDLSVHKNSHCPLCPTVSCNILSIKKKKKKNFL